MEKRFLLFWAGGFVLLILAIVFCLRKKETLLFVEDQKISVEIANNSISRARGLSGRDKLGNNRGMLFIYDKPGIYSFWMNLMKFNLDFVFINGNRVVDLIEDVPFPKRGESPKIVNAKTDFDKVLEVNSGTIGKIGIKMGNNITISK